MIPNISEIVIILIILLLVFGIGKLGNLGATAKQVKANFKKGLESGDREEPIDITPRADSAEPVKTHANSRKPGTQNPGVEDAEIEEES